MLLLAKREKAKEWVSEWVSEWVEWVSEGGREWVSEGGRVVRAGREWGEWVSECVSAWGRAGGRAGRRAGVRRGGRAGGREWVSGVSEGVAGAGREWGREGRSRRAFVRACLRGVSDAWVRAGGEEGGRSRRAGWLREGRTAWVSECGVREAGGSEWVSWVREWVRACCRECVREWKTYQGTFTLSSLIKNEFIKSEERDRATEIFRSQYQCLW